MKIDHKLPQTPQKYHNSMALGGDTALGYSGHNKEENYEMLKKKGEREAEEAAFDGNISLFQISPLSPGNADVHCDGGAIFVPFLII